jgi:hypothetical protein
MLKYCEYEIDPKGLPNVIIPADRFASALTASAAP